MSQPQVIFFDAVGTLFGVKGSVGSIYAEIADRHGVEVAPQTLDSTFYAAFKKAGAPAFPGYPITAVAAQEFAWWKGIVQSTFDQAGVLIQFEDFDAFFAELYSHFATAAPWELYQDTIVTLKRFHDLKIPLGILSNFDSRIYSVLKSLQLIDYFQSITISTEIGAAKPDTHIFRMALLKHNCPPQQAWHIGDSLEEDYRAARAVGIRGIWLNRSKQ
ncbi:MAG: HAD family hydrolase [Synechococcales bacterium]|nr:HAD family hydrolase [Synechococcales bacterium]